MYTSKRNVLETVALLKAHGINRIVLSPGSRNAPLIQCFISDPFFDCLSIIDERSSAYLALGLSLESGTPVVLCCTSGSALLNYAPALAEAYYQQVPLIVLTADRSQAWINQMDGQTLPQPGIFGPLVKLSVQLPEVMDETSLWQCNRLVNEAILTCQRSGKGPVHLNIPLSEPLFDFSVPTLPDVRLIRDNHPTEFTLSDELKERWQQAGKRLILVGQSPSDPALSKVLDNLTSRCDCVILGEYLSNLDSKSLIGNFDNILNLADAQTSDSLRPDLLVTIGGHIVSKRIKQWLRAQSNLEHWDVSTTDRLTDTYQHLSQRITASPISVLSALPKDKPTKTTETYAALWNRLSTTLPAPQPETLPFSDLSVTGSLLNLLPAGASLLVGNSSPIRNVQYYPKPTLKAVYGNRGTNGIEGSLSLATGLSVHNPTPLYVLLGDLSFIHDLSGLWTAQQSNNLRIFLINNGGGGIFHHINGLDLSPNLQSYVAANHQQQLDAWIKAAGFDYLKAGNHEELSAALAAFTDPNRTTSTVLEVFTNPDANKHAVTHYLSTLKNALS